MGKKHDYQHRGGNYGGSNYQGHRGSGDQGFRRENRDNSQNRNYNRDNASKHGSPSSHSGQQRYNNKVKTEETIEDIRVDISRIEKEIELEIKEIRSLKL